MNQIMVNKRVYNEKVSVNSQTHFLYFKNTQDEYFISLLKVHSFTLFFSVASTLYLKMMEERNT